MVEDIRVSFKELVSESKWMDKATQVNGYLILLIGWRSGVCDIFNIIKNT